MSNELEEIQHHLANWQAETELEQLNQLEEDLLTVPEEVLGKSTEDFTDAMRRYLDAMWNRRKYLSQLKSFMDGGSDWLQSISCDEFDGRYALYLNGQQGQIKIRSSSDAEWYSLWGEEIRSSGQLDILETPIVHYLSDGEEFRTKNSEVSVPIIKINMDGLHVFCGTFSLSLSTIGRYRSDIGGDIFQRIEDSGTDAFLAYWCGTNGSDCPDDIATLIERRQWFIDAANVFNIPEFTNMSPEVLATLSYSQVWGEGWLRDEFSPRPYSVLRDLLDGKGLLTEESLDVLSSTFPQVRDLWAYGDQELLQNTPRLSGFSFGLPNLYSSQAIDAYYWWSYLQNPDTQAIHGITLTSNEAYNQYIRENLLGPLAVNSNVWDENEAIERMTTQSGSIGWYTLDLVWNSWRLYSNDHAIIGSGTTPYENSSLPNIYSNYNQAGTRRPEEISVYGVYRSTSADSTNYISPEPSSADIGEARKAAILVENLGTRGEELGYDLTEGVDFIAYTDDEVVWLVEVVFGEGCGTLHELRVPENYYIPQLRGMPLTTLASKYRNLMQRQGRPCP